MLSILIIAQLMLSLFKRKRRAFICVSILCVALAQLLMHMVSISCTSKTGERFCHPQFTLTFSGPPVGSDGLLLALKDLLKLLSYMAIDLGSHHSLPQDADYDEINLVNTLESSNTFKVNFLGYCKDQPMIRELKNYCTKHNSGLDPISLIMRDMGIQFGLLSSKNPKIMGESFVYTYKLGLRAIADTSRNLDKENNMLRRYLKGFSGDPDSEADRIQIQKIVIFANWLLFTQDFCLVINWLNLIEFILSILAVLLATLMTPVILKGPRGKLNLLRLMVVPTFKIIAVSVILANCCCNLSSTLWFVVLRKAGRSVLKGTDINSVRLGSGLILSWVRLLLECILAWIGFYQDSFSKRYLTNDTDNTEDIQLKSLELAPARERSISSDTTV